MRPMTPPSRRNTTAATALALIRFCAAMSTLRPVNLQMRYSASAAVPTTPATVSAVMISPPLGEARARLGSLLFRDVDLAGHLVMADPAELVADDSELAAFGRRERDHVLVAGMNLDVDVDRLERKSVLPVERGDVEAIALALLQLENRPPLPEPAEDVDVGAGGRPDHRGSFLLADLVLVRGLLDLRLVVRRRDAVGLPVQILLADEVPGDHEPEHEETPQKGDDNPDQLDLFDGFVPPDSLCGRCDGHLNLPRSNRVVFGHLARGTEATSITPHRM